MSETEPTKKTKRPAPSAEAKPGELRDRILAVLRKGSVGIVELAREVGGEPAHVRRELLALKRRGEAHAVSKGSGARWSLGAPRKVYKPRRPARQTRKRPRLGRDREVALEILRAPPERLELLVRILDRLD